MSKKINLATINLTTLNILSDFHIAYKAICEYNRQKKEALKKVNDAIETYKQTHDPKKDPTYSLQEFEQKIGEINAWYDEVTKPLKEAQKPALNLVDKDIYYAYAISMLKGNESAKGKVSVGTKGTTFTVEVSYIEQIKGFLETMGCGMTENETALKKLAKSISLRCGGMMKDNKGEYLKLRSVSNFRQILILAFLQYAIIDRKAIIIKADNSLALNMGENA